MRRLHDGFTLIELLVVVGIISILASIATPNYMEAITRSKVAKFKGDARTIETALLSYAVDRQTMPYAEQYPSHLLAKPAAIIIPARRPRATCLGH